MARLIISDEATFHLLSLVEQYPCLWDTGSADYSKTNLKTSVWEHIGMEMMERFPQFGPYSADSLKLLLKNKRRTFREEKKKILQTKSGQPSDDVYIGKWKFYRAMLFLDASDVNPGKRTCSDNYGETIEEGSAGGSDVSTPSTSVEPSSPLPQGDASAVRSTKRKTDSETQSLLEQRTATLERMARCLEEPAPDDCAGFGSVVAQYLRQMPMLKRAKCEAQMMQLIVSHLDE
ncbi:unnamed protein product [Ixodes pacificus]